MLHCDILFGRKDQGGLIFVGMNNIYEMNTLSGLIIFFGLVTWIIVSISVGTFAIVLTIKDGIIRRQTAIVRIPVIASS